MGSATNVVGLTYMAKSTAATNVSFTAGLKTDQKNTGFDDVLTNLTNTQKTAKPEKTEAVSSKDAKNDSLNNLQKDNTVNQQADTNTNNAKADESKVEVKQETAVNTKETNGKEANEELQNAISEDGKKLIEEIAEMADVSEDEIIAVMQMLGIAPQELLNPENIIQVVNALDTNEDGMNLIVDSDLYSSLQDVLKDAEQFGNELMEEFDITPEDLKEAIQTLKPEDTPEEIIPKTDFAKVITEEPVVKENVKEETFKPEAKVEVKHAELVEAEEEITPEFKPELENQNTDKNKSQGNLFKKDTPLNAFNQMVEKIVDAAVGAENTEAVSYTDRAQMENIVRQITEKITVMASDNETSIELSLHPASLGNVNILLTNSKDGITAKFTAQNEIVKEAIESQMSALIQKFDEQGVKVTSVEVTIASHAFEQNLQQDDNGETARDQMQKSKKTLRRINLAEIDEEIEEEMSQAELIAAQMMAYNGNMVDFSA